ncbi:peroxiredoxin-like family protein [Pontiellaceae bacterium B12227]|nr:peroxiredoxin-like family protein [Pontiellaceae bacterium B12227]
MKHARSVIMSTVMVGAVSMSPAEPLKSTLDARKNSFGAKAPDDVKKIYADGIRAVEKSGLTASAKQKGDKAPDFVLTNASGEKVKLSDYLEKGPVVLTWYRGGWCPYCNLTLHALQAELPNFKAEGATLFALTPEVPDKSLSTAEKNKLDFEVLSDMDNKVAREYGVVFKLTDEVAAIYEEKFGLSDYNGNESAELPLAATYVINTDGEIVYAFLDADYRNRAEPSEITAMLKSL